MMKIRKEATAYVCNYLASHHKEEYKNV